MRRSNARSAVYLRAHAVVRLEEVACVCEQLPVGRVVYRFNRGNLRSDGGMRMFEVCLKFGLRAGRAHDQDGSRMRNGRGHSLEKILVYGRMSAVTRIRLVMQVLMGMGALDDGGFARIGIEVKHFCRLMIDPDEGVVVICHASMVARDSTDGDTGHHVLARDDAIDGICVQSRPGPNRWMYA